MNKLTMDELSTLQYKDIAENVYTVEELSPDVIEIAVSVCRRKFKKKDILLMVINDDDQEGYAGFVFTPESIISWTGEGCKANVIPYESIQDVDYEGENVIVTGTDSAVKLWCGDDDDDEWNYTKKMYNFVCDILEMLEE